MKRRLAREIENGPDSLQEVRAVLVSVDGSTTLNYYHDRKPTEQAHVWSVTKSVVSILVGMAIDEGRLRLDQTLAELLPEHVSAMTPAQQAITLKQLLTMTAGFSVDDGGLNLEAEDPVGLYLAYGMSSDPGTTFGYSNAAPRTWSRLSCGACAVADSSPRTGICAEGRGSPARLHAGVPYFQRAESTLGQLLGEHHDDAAGAAYIGEPVHVFVSGYATQGAAAVPSGDREGLVKVVDREGDPVHADLVRPCGLGLDGSRMDVLEQLKPPVTVWGLEHGDVGVVAVQANGGIRPLSTDRIPAQDSQSEIDEEGDRCLKVTDGDSDILELDGHAWHATERSSICACQASSRSAKRPLAGTFSDRSRAPRQSSSASAASRICLN
jgi:hypothetical protein